MRSTWKPAIVSRSLLRCVAAGLAAILWSSPPSIRAQGNPAKELQTRFAAAKEALSAGDLASAETHYIDAIELGLRQAAQLSLSEGKVDEATAYLDSALKLKPDDTETEAEAAGVWFRNGDVSKAKELLKSVVARAPNHVRAHGLLGRIYMFENNSDDAIRELQASINVQDDFETEYFLGIAYLKGKKLDMADSWFQELESKMGNSAALHVLFGRAYLITKFPQKAIAEFEKAIALDPQYPRAHAFLGYAHLEFYQDEGYPRARKEFEKEIRVHPNEYRAYELLGISDVSLRDYAGAEAALRQAVRLQPKEPTLYLYLGETYTATNRIQAAVRELDKYAILIGTPKEEKVREASQAYYLLGQDLRRLGREEEAKKALARSQQLRESKFKYDVKHLFDQTKPPENDQDRRVSDRVAEVLGEGSPEKQGAESMVQHGLPADIVSKPPAAETETKAARQYRASLREVLGSCYNDLGVMRAKDSRVSEAAEFFKQAAAWNPDLAGLDRNWGLASFRAEMYKDAVPPLERHLKTHPDDSISRQVLGLSYSMLENYAKVVEVYRPFLEDLPDDPGLLLAWGTALVRMRQSDAAEKIFQRLLEQNFDNASVHLMLGQAYAQQEEYPNALAEMKTALQLDPRLADAHYYTGIVYLESNDFASAEQEFRAELRLQPTHTLATYHLAYALLTEGHSKDSVPLFREVIKKQPQDELAHFELGRALLEQGEIDGAIQSLEVAKKLVPDHNAVYYMLSRAYRRAGRTPEAAEALATYQKLTEENRLKKRKSMETQTP
jgi:tetratricopeptide (TPR) repeat protein